jgi:hypothetical protein
MSNRINIDSSLWGPKAWFFLDTIILSYPSKPTPEDIESFKQFFLSLEVIIPCEKCRYHYGTYLAKNPLTSDILNSKKKFIKWFLACHNNIRKADNKKEISLDEFYKYYSKNADLQINTETSEVQSNIIERFYIPNYISLMSIVSVFIMLILLIMIKYKKF